jgi:hypothetical protein
MIGTSYLGIGADYYESEDYSEHVRWYEMDEVGSPIGTSRINYRHVFG